MSNRTKQFDMLAIGLLYSRKKAPGLGIETWGLLLVNERGLERLEDRGELVVGLADAAACVLVAGRTRATAVVTIEFPE